MISPLGELKLRFALSIVWFGLVMEGWMGIALIIGVFEEFKDCVGRFLGITAPHYRIYPD